MNFLPSADAALLMSAAPREAADAILREYGLGSADGGIIGVTIRFFQQMYGYEEKEQERFLDEFAAILDALPDNYGRLCFLSTDYTQRQDRKNDLDVVREVQRRMKTPGRLCVISKVLPPSLLKAIYAKCNFMISTRLHPMILASSTGVPGVLFSYAPKCADYMEQIGLAEFCISVRAVNAQTALTAIHALHARLPKIRENMQHRVSLLREKASATTIAAAKLIAPQL